MSTLNDQNIKTLTIGSLLSSSKLINGDTTNANFTLFNTTSESFFNITGRLNVSLHSFDNYSFITVDDDLLKKDHVFDRGDVRVIFTIIYTLVFCCCFFGNLLVILVVTMSRRLRSITNFFLANLAVADLCVGVFCVIQTLTFYLIDSWVFGEFLCKMYNFIHSLSYTASIFILMIICSERYFAIIYPITCKQILTPNRLHVIIAGVWITSALYSIPKFIFSRTVTNIHLNGISEEICIMHRGLFSSKLLDSINLSALYLLPLLVMTILYSRIAIVLWRSSQGIERNIAKHSSNHNFENFGEASQNVQSNRNVKYEKQLVGATESQVSVDSDKIVTKTWRTKSFHHFRNCQSQHSGRNYHTTHSSSNVLLARRGVVRMLIIVVLTFAICNLPLHARKMWQYWSINYHGESNFSALLTPITFLISYFNSAFNPLLYAFLSRNFRKGMREIILCSFKKSNRKAQKRIPLHCLLTFVVYVTADIGITGQNQYLPPNKGYNYERPNIPFGSAPAPQTVIPPRPLPSPGYLPPSGPSISTDHHHHEPGMPFDFAYSVSDYQSANQQSHKATSDGDITRGEYRVNLPDGRIQVVRYTADWKNGYNAMVTYEPSSSPSQGLYGAPSNNAPNQGYIY